MIGIKFKNFIVTTKKKVKTIIEINFANLVLRSIFIKIYI